MLQALVFSILAAVVSPATDCVCENTCTISVYYYDPVPGDDGSYAYQDVASNGVCDDEYCSTPSKWSDPSVRPIACGNPDGPHPGFCQTQHSNGLFPCSNQCEYGTDCADCGPRCRPEQPSVAARKDPHFHMAHGGRTDIRGEDGAVYCFLSARNLSFNVQMSAADFRWRDRLVHGTKMAAASWVVRTSPSGGNVYVEYEAAYNASHALVHLVTKGTDGAERWKQVKVSAGQAPFISENVLVSLSRTKTLTVSTGKWNTSASIAPFPFGKLNRGKLLLDVMATPLYDADHDVVAPHGLFGQSFDGDDMAVDGNTDKLKERQSESRTSSQGEGAIEGSLEDYKLHDKFGAAFKYSRFDLKVAKPRNMTNLTGRKRARISGPGTADVAVSATSHE